MSYADREPEPRRNRLEQPRGITYAAPSQTGRGVIVAFPDVVDIGPDESPRRKKKRAFMRVDPTPQGAPKEERAFPFAFRQGVYVGLSGSPNGGIGVEVPETAFDWDAVGRLDPNFLSRGPGYAIPWNVATISDVDLGDQNAGIIGRADTGTVGNVVESVVEMLEDGLGPGNLGRGGSGGGVR